jgi:mono/diheme cytochrome c family protein
MRSIRAMRALACALTVAIVTVAARPACLPARAQSTADKPRLAGPPMDDLPQMDDLQKADRIYTFRKAASSGPERGREIFYYKCWFCHNEFTKDVPKLTGLFERPTLLSGAPVSDEAVKNQIRNGSADMAAYKYTLSEDDLNDLVSFLRAECCWNSDAPPLNPAYRAR